MRLSKKNYTERKEHKGTKFYRVINKHLASLHLRDFAFRLLYFALLGQLHSKKDQLAFGI